MPGARLIINSRYFHIARAGEKADGKHSMTKEAATGLVEYVGTREGVELNIPDQLSMFGNYGTPLNLDPLRLRPEVAARPATQKQIDTIRDLLEAVPEAKNTLEYQDYKERQTIGNATELISRASELGLGYAVDYGKAANLVEYVGKRPGVDRVGEHGLFSSSPNVDIKKAQEEIANCKGNIWTHVVSLRREDADMLGYNQQKPWRDLVMQKIDVIAKASNIPVSQLHWYAGMHNTTHHPHIHLFVFSDDPKAGHLTVEGIDKMKSAFSEVIFADERRQIYVHKDEMRDGIKQQIDNILESLSSDGTKYFSKAEQDGICLKLTHLASDLKDKSGKKQYGWLLRDPDVRKQVDDIMTDLAKAPEIRQLYDLYCADHIALEQMYREDPKDITPIVNNKEFRSVKNKIIREAIKLSNTVPSEAEADPSVVISPNPNEEAPDLDEGGDMDENPDLTCPETPVPFDDDNDFASLIDSIPPEQEPTATENDWGPYVPAGEEPACHEKVIEAHHPVKHADFKEVYFNATEKEEPKAMYQLAKRYFYGDGVEQDYVAAQMWYGLAAEGGHSMAKYDLGKMYLYGIGIDKDEKLGKEYFLEAYYDFTGELQKATGIDLEHDHFVWEDLPHTDSYHAYLEYLVGRMRLTGEGVDINYQYAFDWFRAASLHGHVHSEYMLGKMIYDGQGVPQSYADAAEYFAEAAEKGDKYASYAVGRMYYWGIGVAQDFAKAASFFTKAAEENVPYADYTLAQMAEDGQGMEKSVANASLLNKKALNEFIDQEKQQPDPLTEFRVAKMFLTGKGTEINSSEAAKWLEKAVGGGNAQAEYELALMYASGEAIAKDEDKAAELFSKALAAFIDSDKDNPSAGQEYRIAQMYEKGLGTTANLLEAINWYSAAAENGHGHAAYKLGKFYADGITIPQNYDAALKWFLKSADGGNAFAAYQAARILDEGKCTVRDETQAAKLFAGALAGFIKLDKGKPDAQLEYRIGSMLLAGKGTAADPQEALKRFLKSADGGNAFAAYQAARILDEGKCIVRDKTQAAKLYAEALAGFIELEKDKPDAQLEYRIGSMFLAGKGTDANPQEALKWLSLSAQKGNIFAAYRAAKLLDTGTAATPKNHVRAQIFYNIALNGFIAADAVKPDSNMEFTIGRMFLQGSGTAVDSAAALRWFILSAEKGNTEAQFQAARILQRVQGSEESRRQAQAYYGMALQGYLRKVRPRTDPFLKYRIGTMYEFSLGVGRDVDTAKKWYRQAAQEGNESAATRLRQIDEFEKEQAAGAVMRLFRFFVRALGHNVQDSTTHKYGADRKLRQKQRMLHKPSQDQEQNM